MPATSRHSALYRNIGDLPREHRGGVVSIGNFDGVHCGHARIVARLLEMANRLGVPAVILTFDPHPARLLHPEQAPAALTSTDYKARLLFELGADAVIAYPTDRDLLSITAEEFFARIVLRQLQARGMVEGANFFFGHDRGGDVALLARFCCDAGIPLEVVDSATIDGQIVSSSRVRASIAAGHVSEAAQLLGRPYRIRGSVVHGQGRGNSLGYPTANIGNIETLLPGEGIYACRSWLEGRPYATAMSLGGNPTFGESRLKVEAFLLDYHGDLYGRPIEIDFLSRLRDIEKFENVDRLVEQIASDVARTREIVKQTPP